MIGGGPLRGPISDRGTTSNLQALQPERATAEIPVEIRHGEPSVHQLVAAVDPSRFDNFVPSMRIQSRKPQDTNAISWSIQHSIVSDKRLSSILRNVHPCGVVPCKRTSQSVKVSKLHKG